MLVQGSWCEQWENKKLIGTMNVVTAYWKRGSIVEDSFLARNSTRKIFVEAYRDHVSRASRDKVL